MKRYFSFILLAFSFVILPAAHAATIEDWSIKVSVNDDRTSEWTVSILYNETVARGDYFVLSDVFLIETLVDNEPAACNATAQVGTLMQCNTVGKHYVFRFRTAQIVEIKDKFNTFQYRFSVTEITDKLSVTVKLPLGAAVVEKALLEGTGLQPFEPSYGKEGSDGRRIFVEWTLSNPKLGEAVPVSIIYEQINESELFTNFVIIIAAIVAGFFITLIYFFGRHDVKDVLPVLTEPERRVVEMLLREKEVDQRTIVKETEYSKAKVSRIIHDMQERGILEKVRKGRKNIIKLKKELKSAEISTLDKKDKKPIFNQ